MLDPVFIEPNFTYFRIDSTIRYNINITTLSPKNMSTIVSNVITNYNENYLNDFAVEFRRSPFTTAIDDADLSMISNVTRVSIYKKFNPDLQTFTNAILSFGVKLENLQQLDIDDDDDIHTVSSTFFMYKGMRVLMKDDGIGGLWIYHSDAGIDKKIAKIGSVDYLKGTINIENFYCDSYEGSTIKLYAIPGDDDIIIPKDTIASIEPDEIHLTVEALKR
jgi:hypothetical protein